MNIARSVPIPAEVSVNAGVELIAADSSSRRGCVVAEKVVVGLEVGVRLAVVIDVGEGLRIEETLGTSFIVGVSVDVGDPVVVIVSLCVEADVPVCVGVGVAVSLDVAVTVFVGVVVLVTVCVWVGRISSGVGLV